MLLKPFKITTVLSFLCHHFCKYVGTQHSCTASDAEVAFVMDEYTVGEEFGNVGVCVDTNVTDGFQTDLTVFLSAIDGKASECICLEHSLDYVLTLTVSAC